MHFIKNLMGTFWEFISLNWLLLVFLIYPYVGSFTNRIETNIIRL